MKDFLANTIAVLLMGPDCSKHNPLKDCQVQIEKAVNAITGKKHRQWDMDVFCSAIEFTGQPENQVERTPIGIK